jgi:hypothetical protein
MFTRSAAPHRPVVVAPFVTSFCLLVGLALTATCSKPTGSSADGNLLGGKSPQASSGVLNAERMTDGVLATEGDFWQTNLTARLSTARSRVTYDLGAVKPVACALVQGDNNDTYRLEGSTDGTEFAPLWVAGPAEGAGMRLRQGTFTGSARYLRVSASGGDGLYTVSELAVYGTCPTGWPASAEALPRKIGVAPGVAVRDALIALGLTWALFLLVYNRQSPRWIAALGVVPVLAFVHAVVKVAEIYPFPNTDEESLVRAVVAFVAGVLVIKEAFFPARLAPHPKVARASLGLLAVLAVGCYYHFGSNQFMDAAKGRLTVVHTWDMRNYFPTVKYFKEVRFDGMYLACLAAYVDVVGKGDPASVHNMSIRDLTDYHMLNGPEAAAKLPEIRARFSPERWEEFKKDMKYFIDTMGPRDYIGSMSDHGGNATPVWMLPAWLLYRNLPASELTLGLAGLIDPVLLLIFFVVLARTFGLRVMLYTVILFGATDFYQFGSNLMGSTLRQDWLVALGLGACALKRGRPFLGGFLLAYGGLIRAFPAVAALFLIVPVALFLGEALWRRRRLPGRAELLATQGQSLRAIAGAAVAVVGLFLVTSGVFGYRAAWVTWVEKIAIHAVGPSSNNVGLRNVLAYRPHDSARALVRRQVPDTWVEWEKRQFANFNQLRPVFYLVNALAFGLLLVGVARRPSHQTTLLGLLLVPFLFYPSNYYCHFVFLLPMAVAGRGVRAGPGAPEAESDPDARLFGLVTAVIASMSVGQYFTMQEGWTDQRYTYQSFLLLAGFAAIIVALGVEGWRTLAAERRQPRAETTAAAA